MTTQLEKILATVVGLLISSGAALGWWVHHNHAEQKIGAVACIQANTETKQTAVADNAADATDQAKQLTAVVETYDKKVADLSRSNATLAASLHAANRVHQSSVPGAGSATGTDLCPVELPERQGDADRASARGLALERAETQVFNDCDADWGALQVAVTAYNDWRDRIIAENKTRAK